MNSKTCGRTWTTCRTTPSRPWGNLERMRDILREIKSVILRAEQEQRMSGASRSLARALTLSSYE